MTHLANYDKEQTPSYVFKQEIAIIRDLYPEYHCIYTDGSKCNEKVACAYVTEVGTISLRLPDNVSIFTAEAKAVERALQFVKTNAVTQNFLIFTDSLSLIQSLQNMILKNPLIGKIIRDINLSIEKGKNVVFCWVPSHCGIYGNEKADLAAKEALNKPISSIKIPYSDKIPLIRKFLQSKWQSEWDKQTSNKLNEIKPKVGPPFTVHSSRKDQVVLNRIRIGHSRLTHSFLMENNKQRPKCHFCNLDVELTIKHIMIECSYFSVLRSNYYIGILHYFSAD